MNLCLHCRRRLLTCVCSLLKPFETSSRFLLLMHPMEYKKEKVGTGRFSHLILKNSEIIVDINFDENSHFQRLLNDPFFETFLVYPGTHAVNLGDNKAVNFFNDKKKQFILIDGTWPCAKKMMKLSTSLHSLPRVTFSSDRISEFKVKHQPLPGCLSTVESIFQLIKDLNNLGIEHTDGLEDNLLEVFRHTVAQQITLASDPEKKGYRRKSYSASEDRKISKKWSQRLLFFKS